MIDWKKSLEVLAVVAAPIALVAGSIALAGHHGGARRNPESKKLRPLPTGIGPLVRLTKSKNRSRAQAAKDELYRQGFDIDGEPLPKWQR